MAHPTKHLNDPPAVRRAFDRVRAICMALPHVYEKESWGEPTFRVEKGKMFLMFADDHHGDGKTGFWCMSTEDAREALLAIDADRFYVPPYMGPSGWVGAQITGRVPWDILEEVIREAHRLGALPKPKVARAGGVTRATTRTRAKSKAAAESPNVATPKTKTSSPAARTAKAATKKAATSKAATSKAETRTSKANKTKAETSKAPTKTSKTSKTTKRAP